ncbi:MAG: DUF3303 domain-containing protein [bacterium]|nr:DUF3303 domain-containing protein [bacterium]
MLYAMYYEFSPENRNQANERFRQTGGPPPDGVTMIGRWHSIAGGEGVVICESNDPVAVGKWMHDWSDLLKFRIVPVVNDQDVATIIGAG